VGGTGVLPNPADRLAPARRRLGAPTTLWAQQSMVRARVPQEGRAHVYLDVSGSMLEVLPQLVGLLTPYVAVGAADTFQFSTRVKPLPLAKLRKGTLTTTYGTDIVCLLEHALADHHLSRVLIITDGYVGQAPAALARRVQDRHLQMHVVLPGEGGWERDLAPIATSMITLPSIKPASGKPASGSWRV
jgi:hypothetical protein